MHDLLVVLNYTHCFLNNQLLESVSKRPNLTDEEFAKKDIISKKNRKGNRFPCKSVGDS